MARYLFRFYGENTDLNFDHLNEQTAHRAMVESGALYRAADDCIVRLTVRRIVSENVVFFNSPRNVPGDSDLY